jgi:hypothetical protein
LIEAVIVRVGSDGISRVDRSVLLGIGPVKDGEQRERVIREPRNLVVSSAGMDPNATILSAYIDLAVFLDGQVVGPDKFSSEAAVMERIVIMRNVASLPQNQLASTAAGSSGSPPENERKAAAINVERNPSLVDFYLSLPEKLWRTK